MADIVLGGGGAIGRALCVDLIKSGHEVRCFDIALNPDHDLRYWCPQISREDVVWFLAWDVGGSKYLQDTSTFYQQIDWNVSILANLVPALNRSGAQVVFVSSQLAGVDRSPYSVTKMLGEIWMEQVPGAKIVRQWNVYGQDEPIGDKSHLIPDLVHQAITLNEIRLLTTGSERRRFIHISDVLSGYQAILHHGSPGVPYELVESNWISVLEVANMVAHLVGPEVRVIPGQILGASPLVSVGNLIPDWTASTSFAKGLSAYVEQRKEAYSR